MGLDSSIIAFHNGATMRTPLRLRSVFLSLILPMAICSTVVTAQEANTVAWIDQKPQFTLQTERSLVLVRVTVRDVNGQPVRDLKKENFELYDNGKRQTIAQFSFEGAGEETAAALEPSRAQSSEQPLSTETSAKETGQIPEVFVAMYFDDLHMLFGDIVQTREAAERYIASSLRPNQRVAIYTSSGIAEQGFTSDRSKLQSAVRKLQPRPAAGGLAVPEGWGERIGGIVGQGQAEKESIRVMDLIVRTLSDMPGRRTVVYVSSGFVLQDEIMRRFITEVSDRAVRAGVTVNAIDSRGLYATLYGAFLNESVQPSTRRDPNSADTYGGDWLVRAQKELDDAKVAFDGPFVFAYMTGGMIFDNKNDMATAFRLAGGLESYSYLLAYAPVDMKQDGRFHQLKVTLSNAVSSRNLIVQARRGYYAPGKRGIFGDRSEEELSEWVISPGEMTALPVSVKTQTTALPTGKYELHVDVRVDARALRFEKRDERNLDKLTIATAVFDNDGNYVNGIRKTVEMSLSGAKLAQFLADGLSVPTDFELPPGTYLLRQVVRESGGAVTTRNLTVKLP
jgi:VWFA-related protein